MDNQTVYHFSLQLTRPLVKFNSSNFNTLQEYLYKKNVFGTEQISTISVRNINLLFYRKYRGKKKGYITILQIGILISKFSNIIMANNGINKVKTQSTCLLFH